MRFLNDGESVWIRNVAGTDTEYNVLSSVGSSENRERDTTSILHTAAMSSISNVRNTATAIETRIAGGTRPRRVPAREGQELSLL